MMTDPAKGKTANISHRLGNSSYAGRRKEYLVLLQKLRAVGADAVIDVPKIVVIGNQSAGKSSLVEAISGISLPRDSGTCTRCPMECRMKSSDDAWLCQISIRWEYDADDQKRDVVEVPFGGPITDPTQVEFALRCAQAAVLHPHVEPHMFVGLDEDGLLNFKSDKKARSFSRNVVCIELQGPDLTDLAFIDLPGLIQNADEPGLVGLVEQLVRDHIQGSSLILVTIPMSDDIDNQKALSLAREADPEGRRTIGVLTKPDVMGQGSKSRSLYLDVIEGRSKPLHHGYYCTRSPDDDERADGITHAEARQAEASYFEITKPWNTSLHKNRFGIKNLVAMLSPLLERIIKDSLPRVNATATESLKVCEEELAKLPAAITTEPATYMLELITSLSNAVAEYVKGGQGREDLIRENRAIWRSFREAIRATTPQFLPYMKSDASQVPVFCNTLDGEEDSEHDATANDSEPIVLRKRLLDGPFYLDDMRAHVENSMTRELPNNVPFSAKASLIKEFQHRWSEAARACFSAVHDNLMHRLLACVHSDFGRWEILHGQMRNFITDLVKKHADACQSIIKTMLESERTPFTQNEHYLHACEEKWLSKYRDARAAACKQASSPSEAEPASYSIQEQNELLAHLMRFGHQVQSLADLAKLSPPDEFETEMVVMAQVRSYFQVAFKRVIDTIPSIIDFVFLKGVQDDMQNFLLKKIQIGGKDGRDLCARYLAEDPDIVARRDEIVARQETLEKVKAELYSFGI